MGVSGSFLGDARKCCSLTWYPGNTLGLHLSQNFAGDNHQPYLFSGLTTSVLQSSWPQEVTCFMLVHKERKNKRGPLPQSTHASNLGETWNWGLTPLGKLLLILQNP